MNVPFNTMAIICRHVRAGERSVLLVSRIDGQWQFLCGEAHAEDVSEYCVGGLGHVVVQDPTLVDVLDLPEGWDAERDSVGAPWRRFPSMEE